jgi:GTP-binding protein Era
MFQKFSKDNFALTRITSPKDQLTDKPERFFVNETIRKKILLNYSKEIPYAVEIVTEEF